MTTTQKIQIILNADLQKLNNFILKNLESDITLINKVSFYITTSSGKRLRPLILLLTAKIFNCKSNKNIAMACVLEYIHTATLLHDDVIDKTKVRRNIKTVHEMWTNKTAILVGDFLYSRAFQIMLTCGKSEILKILANATNKIAEGEVLQLQQQHNYNTTKEIYFNIIKLKTATLFEAATAIGSILSNATSTDINYITKCGHHLGIAYQINNDIADYIGDNTSKNCFDDIKEGKTTLPLIYAIANVENKEKIIEELRNENTTQKKIDKVLKIIETTNAITFCKKTVEKEVELALSYINKLSVKNENIDLLKDFIKNILAQ